MINKSKIKKISISSNCNNIFKECSNLIYRIPVFLSHPNKLNSKQREFVEIIIKEIRKALFFPRTLPNTEQYPETPLTNIRRMILSSYGFIALDLAQIEVRTLQNNLRQSIDSTTWEGSPFAQIEPAINLVFQCF